MPPPISTIAVLVPTYRRPEDLRRCLNALAIQKRPADSVVVVVRDEDAESQQLLAQPWNGLANLRKIVVDRPGQVHALNRGLEAISSDAVAITDDDAAPRPDWLERVVTLFANDPEVGGVGGRDWL